MSIVILLTELTSLGSLPTKILIVWLLGLISLYIYRLYFSPISHFPGPKLAAISRWYEAYYEIILDGQYSRKIAELHDQYGLRHIPLSPSCRRSFNQQDQLSEPHQMNYISETAISLISSIPFQRPTNLSGTRNLSVQLLHSILKIVLYTSVDVQLLLPCKSTPQFPPLSPLLAYIIPSKGFQSATSSASNH